MEQQFLTWIRTLTMYMVLISLLLNLIPGTAYLKYIKLFSSLLFLLLFLQPFSRGLGLEKTLAYASRRIALSFDQKDLQAELAGQEERRLQELLRQYRESAAGDLMELAGEVGLSLRDVSVVMETDPANENFGRISSIVGTLNGAEAEARNGNAEGEEALIHEFRRKAAGAYGLSEAAVRIVS